MTEKPPRASGAARAAVSTDDQSDGRLPDFVIIGAMKAATSSLQTYLDAHPEAVCSREPHFFCCNYANGVEWYRNHFAGNGSARVVGEKTPHYLHSNLAIDRMATLLPDAKLIALLRDPVDRALSHYWHERRRKRENLNLREALAAEDERMAAGHTNLGYVDRGRYFRQLQHVTARYPREALLVVLFEDLRDRPVATFKDVCRFLGIDDTVVPPVVGRAENVYRKHRPEWLWRFMFRRRLWRRLPRRAAQALGQWMTRDAEYPPMERDLRRELTATFEPENRALAEWLGRDLHEWQRSPI